MAISSEFIPTDLQKLITSMRNALMDSFIPTPLASYELQSQRVDRQLQDSLKKFKECLMQAKRALFEEGFSSALLNEESIDLIFNPIGKGAEEEKIALSEQIGFKPDDLIKMYQIGTQYFDEKKYEEARDIFILLTKLDGEKFPFWSALGMAEQALGQFETAAIAYSYAAELDPENPSHYLFVAHLLFLQGKVKEAVDLLQLVMEEVRSNEEFKVQAQELINEWQNN